MTKRRSQSAAAVAIPPPPQSAAALLAAMERAAAPAQAALDGLRDRTAAALRRSGAIPLILSFLDSHRQFQKLFPFSPVSEATRNASMDLASLVFTDNAVMPVIHPAKAGQPLKTADGEPISITLASMDSDVWRKAQTDMINERFGDKPSAATMEDQTLQLLGVATVGWKNIISDGERLTCTPQAAKGLYRKLPWLRQQVEAFVSNRGNFLRTDSAA